MARDRAPSFQFYPRDFVAAMQKHGLNFDQQGRYWHACSLSWDTDTPGEADEDTWRRWMGYTPKAWEKAREVMSRPFKIRDDGVWVQTRMVETRAEQMARFSESGRGGKKTQEQLSPDQRSEAAKRAARARWGADPMPS